MMPPSPFASRLAALGLLGLAGCAPIESSEPTGDPRDVSVGRLKFNDRVVDLTPEAFADGPNAVPRNAIGQIIADIDLRETPDVSKGKNPAEDSPRSRGLRR